VAVRAWFSPGRGPELSHRIAKRIGAARRRVRIASPVLTAAPILAALNEALSEGRVDVAIVDPALAERMAAFVDAVRERYPAV